MCIRDRRDSVMKQTMEMSKTLSPVKFHNERVHEQSEKHKEKAFEDEEERINKMVHKLVDREMNFLKFKNHMKKLNDEKRKALETKMKTLNNHKEQISSNEKEKLDQLQERFRKVEEYLHQKKTKENERLLLEIERRKLVELDKKENYDRNKRVKEFKHLKNQIKDKRIEEKLEMMRMEQEVLMKTKMEVYRQLSVERERINGGVQSLTWSLPSIRHSLPQKNPKSMKILRTIFTDDEIQNEFAPPDEAEKPAQPILTLPVGGNKAGVGSSGHKQDELYSE
eukprot:TRINITY_DN4788_c0_g1_i4.p1 TRINITY_DN4788_c0_g1~~TRINITY_DN4788_c0_g1_i4.p1  ORF type:complete len:326 (+),score=82.16 TRINITY_DN4788_c0_g1_i4:136-978(+)